MRYKMMRARLDAGYTSKYNKHKQRSSMEKKINPEQLKEVMRAWITGVAIVTGFHQGSFHGMTANSFNSITLSPPTVLVALQQHTRTRQLVKEGGVFAVSILGSSQSALARRFAGQSGDDRPRFEGVETFTLTTGAPLIKNSLAYLDCKVIHTLDVGATTIFLGEVLHTDINPSRPAPLLYFNQQWRKLAD